MNDLKHIRSAFPEPPAPTPQVTVDARRQLSREVSGTSAGRRTSWLGTHRFGAVLTAGAATVAIGALALPLVLPDGRPPAAGDSAGPAIGAPASEPQTTKQLLLAAAAHQERERSTGRYFRFSSLSTGTSALIQIGSGPTGYRLSERVVYETWTARREGGGAWLGTRSLGVRPASAADREKWQRAGAPTTWKLGATDTIREETRTVTTGPDKGRLDKADDSSTRYFREFGGKGMTVDQIQDLPTDPATLREHLLSLYPTTGVDVPADDRWLFTVATRLVSSVPAPPKVRAAALRLIAGLSGVVDGGQIKDSLGRSGTVITLVERSTADTGTAVHKERLVIDPKSGKVLSLEIGDTINGRVAKAGEGLILFSGWTDEEPRIPSATVK